MSAFWKSIIIALVLLMFVYVTLLVAATTDANGVCSRIDIGCLMRTYQDLSGGLIGAAGTIFAGWLAWLAVQSQLAHDREIATQIQREAKDVAISELRDILGVLNQMWRALDAGLLETNQNRIGRWSAAAETLYADVPRMIERADFRKIASELGPIDRQRLLQVAASLDHMTSARTIHRRALEQQNFPQDFRHHLQMDRIMLSHLHQYLLVFDQSSAAIFDGRTKNEVDHRGMAAHMQTFMDAFEQDLETR